MTPDLRTSYMGLKLKNPLVISASPLSAKIDDIKRLEDFGASAIVLHSLFEEQLRQERLELHHHLTHETDSFAEAQSFFPEADDYHLGPEEYMAHIQKAKKTAGIPIIASLNGTAVGDWVKTAAQMQKAGADAIELNVYFIPTDLNKTSAEVEQIYLDILKAVKSAVSIPVAIKLSRYFTNIANMAKRVDEAGADALVLFNRFYQPDIDLDGLEVRTRVLLSTQHTMRLPMRWIAILYGKIRAQLAASGGVHQAQDAIKMLMAGANVTMLCSTLLQRGIEHLKVIEHDMVKWMQEHEYESVRQMQGSMSQKNSSQPGEFERAHYMRALQSISHPVDVQNLRKG